MRDRELYAQLLGIESPRVELTPESVEVYLESGSGKLPCPECGTASPRYDSRERRWRHLDTMQYKTVLVAEVPRVQ